MTPQEELLVNMAEQVKENNAILRSIQREQRLSMLWRGIKLVVYLVLLFIAYKAIMPYLSTLQGLTSGDSGTAITVTPEQAAELQAQFQNLLGN